jgi:hypothetical protein
MESLYPMLPLKNAQLHDRRSSFEQIPSLFLLSNIRALHSQAKACGYKYSVKNFDLEQIHTK